MSENVTLSDLSNGAVPTATPVVPQGIPTMPTRLDKSTVKPLDRKEAVLPPKAVTDPNNTKGNPMLDQAFNGLMASEKRLREESEEIYDKGVEERIEKDISSDSEDEIEKNISNTYVVNTFDDIPVEESPLPKSVAEPVIEQVVPTMKTVEVKDAAPVSGTVTKKINILEDETPEDNKSSEDDIFNLDIDAEDLKFLDDEDDDEQTEDEKEEEKAEKEKTEALKNNIRKELNDNFNPYSNKFDLSRFSISKKAINASKVISEINSQAIECADGVLYSEKRPIRMSAFKPLEIQSLDPQLMRNGNFNSYTENQLKLIYDHIIDANKPKSFEAWAKITPNTTIEDYMFTAYKATFGKSNIITFSCEDNNCSNVFMESIPVNSMIKFEKDEVKDEYFNILKSGTTDSNNDSYKVDLVQVSDKYVFGLKVPSLYNTYIEPTLLDTKFQKKYENLVLILMYIEDVYIIDAEHNQLIPVDTKPVPNNKALTYQRRIKTYATIIKSLTSDQLQALSVATDKYDAGELDDEGELLRDISYIYPEKVCPKCGKKIAEQKIDPTNMLFTRHQLGLMKKI